MRPLRGRVVNYVSFGGEHVFDFPQGATAIVGSNGSGKTSYMAITDVATFGPRGRSLEPLVTQGCDEMLIELEIEHAGTTYRIRREWRRGRSSLDFELWDGEWRALTQGSATDTQSAIEATFGLTRDTFRCSGYLAQRESDSFTGAQPRDRKSILGNALALHDWNDRASRVGTDRLALQKTLAEGDGRLEMLAEQVAQRPDAVAALEILSVLLARSGADITGAEAKLDVVAQAVKDAEQAVATWTECKRQLESAQQQVDAHSRVAIVADSARHEIERNLHHLEQFSTAENAEDLEITERALTAAYETWTLRKGEAIAKEHAREDLLERGRRLGDQCIEAQAIATGIEHGDHPLCVTCGQELDTDAREKAVKSALAEVSRLAAEGAAAIAEATMIEIPDVGEQPDSQEIDELRVRIQNARKAAASVAELKERIAGLERTIGQVDTPEYRLETERLNNLHQACIDLLNETSAPEPGALPMLQAAALQAKAALEEAGRVHTQTTADHARAAALLQQLDHAVAQHAELTAQRAEHVHRLDILTRLEQAFGRDGVPAWIVETQALPTIETHANDALQRLGGPITHIELRTERETKAGEKREALDVICHTADGERALETFSGGEQARAEIACALGLTQLLATRRGADLRYLALDEPPGLDLQGHEALAGILKDLVQHGVQCVMVASHDTALRDSFDQSVTLENRDGRSLVTV